MTQPKPNRAPAERQRQKAFLATVLLLLAVAIVLVRDRQFWFGPDPVAESDEMTSESSPSETAQQQPAPANKSKKHVAEKGPTPATVEGPTVTTTNRAALPPLDVEVVKGDDHETLRAGSNAVKVEIPRTASEATVSTARNSAQKAGLVTKAGERARISEASLATAVQTDNMYPLLTPQSKVQGSVVLQARIGANGVVEDLQVLSGPAILASAAKEAVRRWQFKPYLQNGQPVETFANITVNFTIKVAGNPALAS